MDTELEQMTKKINKWKRHRKRAIKLAVDGTAQLRRMKTSSMDSSEAFARAFYEWNLRDDKVANGEGDYSASLLPFEWCIERYAGLKLWQWLPILQAIHNSLVDRKFVRKNHLSYNDLDNNACYIPHKSKQIMVWGSQQGEILVVLQPSFINGMCVHVRRVWPRRSMQYGFSNLLSLRSYAENNYEGEYGDCRDKGYILSYKGDQISIKSANSLCTKNPGKIDWAYAYWSEFSSFMLSMRFLVKELDIDIKKLVRSRIQ